MRGGPLGYSFGYKPGNNHKDFPFQGIPGFRIRVRNDKGGTPHL